MTLATPPRARGSRRSREAGRPNQTLWVALEWGEAHCVIPDGFRKGEPFRLYNFQGQYLATWYLVKGSAEWVPSAPILGPAFVYRRAMIVGPQKMGKDPLEAFHICVEAVGPALFAGWAGRDEGYSCRDHGCGCGWEYAYEVDEPKGMAWPTPLIQVTAFSEDQTDNTYSVLRPMIDEGPLSTIVPRTGEEFIRLPGGGRIDVVTSSAQSRLGQRTTFISQGEVGIWTSENKMMNVANVQWRGTSAMGGRVSMNTNAWDPAEGSAAQVTYESKASDIYVQFTQPPPHLSYGDRKERHRIHLAVYPEDVRRENGGHLDLAGVEAEADDLVHRDPRQAERFYGNRLVAGAGRAIDPDVWDALAFPRDLPRGTYVGLGFDGSINQDATFLRGCTRFGYSFIVQSWERPAGAPRDWVVPRLEVHEALAWAFGYYNVGLLLADPPKWWTELEEWTVKYGKDHVEALDTNQHVTRFSAACDRWLTAINVATTELKSRPFGPFVPSYCHDADPLTSEHVKNAHLRKLKANAEETDGRSRFVIVKGPERRRIDGAVAEVLALEAAMTMPDLPEPVVPLVRYGRRRR